MSPLHIDCLTQNSDLTAQLLLLTVVQQAAAPLQSAQQHSLLANIISLGSLHPIDGLNMLLEVCRELCQLCLSSTSKGTSSASAAGLVPSLLSAALLQSLQRDRTEGHTQVMMLAATAALSHSAPELSAGRAPVSRILTLPQAEVVLQAVAAAVSEATDPLLALLVLRALLSLQDCKVTVRKLLLGLAEVALRGTPSCRQIALTAIIQSTRDQDSSVRARAIGGLTPDLGLLFEPSSACRWQQPTLAADRLLSEAVLQDRMMDAAKSVRAKALTLMTAVFELELNSVEGAATVSAFQTRVLGACFPQLCDLMSQDAGLHADATQKVGSPASPGHQRLGSNLSALMWPA